MKNPHVSRWLHALFITAALPLIGHAAEGQPAAMVANTNFAVSGLAVTKRAAWQQHLTLGPGDILSFSLYGEDGPVEVWPNIAIGPDGRVSYLEARDIAASGLTIDELRTNVDAALVRSSNYNGPHAIITPVTITSKRYVVLGAVVTKGEFLLDRPLTLVEAIARSGGLETGIAERNTVELADLAHSFLVRRGERLPVDFEQLFQHGDLNQNVSLEPDDYLYLASSGANEVYVLGEVAAPGPAPFASSSTVIGAITARGSFTGKAYRGKILVVRGSLERPETFAVSTSDILKGKDKNFRLKPRDIVYVAQKPWEKAEELLDAGTRAFIESVVVTYTGAKIGPFMSPILH